MEFYFVVLVQIQLLDTRLEGFNPSFEVSFSWQAMPVGTHTGKNNNAASLSGVVCLLGAKPQTPFNRTMLVRLRVLRTLNTMWELSGVSCLSGRLFFVAQQTVHIGFCSQNGLHLLPGVRKLWVDAPLLLKQFLVFYLDFFESGQLL